jgi:hypothetical protein
LCDTEECTPSSGLCDTSTPTPEARECVPADDCETAVCVTSSGRCLRTPINSPECNPVEICRTPGFWGTHADDAEKNKENCRNITQEVIDATLSDSLTICGKIIGETTDLPLPRNDSAVEALCVAPKGEPKLQLARQLTAAALNCVLSYGPGHDNCSGSSIEELFAECSSADACSGNVGTCIEELDCFNNGGTWNEDGPKPFCQTGECANGDACNSNVVCSDESTCTPIEGCHDRQLVTDWDNDPETDPDLNFEPPGPACSSSECNAANKNSCDIFDASC